MSGRALGIVASVMLAGCGGGLAAAGGDLEPETEEEAFRTDACDALKVQEAPDLMAWNASARANLSRLSKQGIVPVHYSKQGCNIELELLPNCKVRGNKRYKFAPYARSETKVAKSKAELYAKLPLGAVGLEGKVGGNRSLRTDYMMVGTLSLPGGYEFNAQRLTKSDDCDRATHVITTIYVGGFAMASGASQDIEAGASVFGVEAGAKSSEQRERLASEGNAAACKDALQSKEGEEAAMCNVPLRVNLMSIQGREHLVNASANVKSGDEAKAARRTTCPKDMALVEGGVFRVGRKQISIDNFCMDKTEVTTGDFTQCIKDKKCILPEQDTARASERQYCNYGKADRSSHPMNCVTHDEAATFCQARGKRIPLHHEWLYAAGGNDGRKYPWGNELGDGLACYDRKLSEGTCPVGQFPDGKSPFGLLDMAGNVSEYTVTETNAAKAAGGSFRANRGSLKVTWGARAFVSPGLGFRCVVR